VAGGICPVLVGPTAAGKTGLVTALAARHPVEVISLDSRQIYRGLRIGTAQPTAAEQAACPHHLVDFVPPQETYSAARFRRDFEAAWREIRARGRLPILVGGAGLYLSVLREGLLELPADAEERLPGIRAELDGLDDAAVERRLAAVDPESHARLHPRDRYRRLRALEIHALAGRPLSALARDQERRPSLGLAFPALVLVRDPAELEDRIARRTDAMLAAGWIEETEALVAVHGAGAPGLASIGYREVVAHLSGELDRDAMRERIVVATRQYAKRQRTWFRHSERVGEFRPEDPTLLDALSTLIERALAAARGAG
jgi:tRNA dimethylallyltransferase